MTTAMATETAQSPDVVAALVQNRAAISALAAKLPWAQAPLAVICGRGSSGHAGVFLRYLIETRLSLPVSATAPSVMTLFKRPLALDRALFIVISQSGRSPDLVAATKAARAAGARTIALVNATASPVADAAEYVIDLQAGEERSVAATKSVIASMAAGAELIAAMAGDRALTAALDRLPERLRSAAALDWTPAGDDIIEARCVFATGRGYGFGPAREIALKIEETLRLPSLAYSAAELLHGPRAAISSRTPLLALRQADETADALDDLVEELRNDGVKVHDCGGANCSLPWIGDDHPVTDAITMLMPAYRMIETTARRLYLDPDHPPHLKKITETL